MKRHLTESEKLTLLEEFKKHLDEVTNGKVSYTKEIKPTGKVKIYYTPEAFSKTVRLIMSHTMEIAWHCLVRKKDKDYEVYDVLSYPQTVGPAHVHVKMGRTFGDGKPKDPTKYYTDWYNEVVLSMPEEEERNLCGQCHSHVNMSTSPSSVDMTQQKEELELKGRTGYYLFQIWNKKLEVNTFLYDLDAGVLYEKDDVEIIVEEDDFTTMSHEMLVEPEPEKLPKNKQEEEMKTTAKQEKNDKYEKYGSYGDYDGYDDYYDSYERYYTWKYKNLNKYIVPVQSDKNYVEYVVEAHSAVEADRLFNDWAIENYEIIEADLLIDEASGLFDFEIKPASIASDDEHVDILYSELTGAKYVQ
jgi:hypothetical protein